MAIAALTVACVAAAVHGYVFVLESLLWTGPRARRIFGLDEHTARTTAPLAFNQGFYNLFLALEIVLGTILWSTGRHTAGAVLVLVGALSMVAAGIVLIVSDRSKVRPALIQILPALIGSLLMIATLTTH